MILTALSAAGDSSAYSAGKAFGSVFAIVLVAALLWKLLRKK